MFLSELSVDITRPRKVTDELKQLTEHGSILIIASQEARAMNPTYRSVLIQFPVMQGSRLRPNWPRLPSGESPNYRDISLLSSEAKFSNLA